MMRAWLLLLLLGSGTVEEAPPVGPYGLEERMSLAEVEKVLGAVAPMAPHTYLGSPPEGVLAEISTLTLFLTREDGLCRIQGTSDVIVSDPKGTQLRDRFSRLLEVLWAKYGEPKIVDTLVPDSQWPEDDQWLQALLEGDRVVLSLWNRETGARLADGVISVVLAARGLEPGKGYLHLEHTFSNWAGCEARIAVEKKEKVEAR